MAINPGESPVRPVVLVVDDEADIRDGIHAILTDPDFRNLPVVLRANAPASAVQAIKGLKTYLDERAAYDRKRAEGISAPVPLVSEGLARALGYNIPRGEDSMPEEIRRQATEQYGHLLNPGLIMYLDRMMPIDDPLRVEFSAILSPTTKDQHAPFIVQEAYRREFGDEQAARHLAIVMMSAAQRGQDRIVPGLSVAYSEFIAKPYNIDELEARATEAENAIRGLGHAALQGPYPPQDTHQ